MDFESLEELRGAFALFDDWEERYRFLIELGAVLPDMSDALKTDGALVPGCTSRVWMVPRVVENDAGDAVFQFIADSDAQIVRGLVAILFVAYNDCPVKDIGDVDIEAFFTDVGLDKHLSPNRRNGFFSIVEKIKSYAAGNQACN